MKKVLVLGLAAIMLFASVPADAAYVARPGDVIKTANSATVFVVMDNLARMPISAEGYAIRYNNDFSRVITVTEAERGTFSDFVILGDELSFANGKVFMYETNQPGIWLVQNGFKRLFSTWTGFQAMGYEISDVEWAGTYTMYPTGAPVQ